MFTNEKEKERDLRERSERVWEGEKKGVKCTTVDCDVFGRGEKKGMESSRRQMYHNKQV